VKLVRPDKLTTREPFNALFPIQPHVLAAIKERMETDGLFDESKPLDVWEQGDILIVVDGHTRLQAAKDAGIDVVAVFEHDFPNEDAALEYAIRNQRNRRNLTDADILRLVVALDKRKQSGERTDLASSEARLGKSAEATAELLGASRAKVERTRAVIDYADEETKAAVESGKTINAAYQETQEKRKQEEAASDAVIWSCEACGKETKTETWHCPECARHVSESRATCPKCNYSRGYLQSKRAVDAFVAESPVIAATPDVQPVALTLTPPKPKAATKPTFNYQTGDGIEWAKWSWNPVTGCLHDCGYCYAREIANRYYAEKFKPTYHPERLSAPHNTKQKPNAATNVGERNVFVGSMADLFGHWVPQEWIDAVLDECRKAPQWNFLFLSKNPKRYVGIDWPANAWVGTTVDEQKRVLVAERAFARFQAPVKFLSCEPLLEPLTFASLEMFDWIIIGGQSANSQVPEFQPPWEWVESLMQQARAAGCKVYLKPNLKTRPKEYPVGALREPVAADPNAVADLAKELGDAIDALSED